MLARLESVESRLESVESRLESVESRLGSLESRFDARFERVEDELHDLNKKFGLFLKDLFRLQDKQDDLVERVSKLENTPAA